MPEVDPERVENQELREGLNSQVAEEYNSWINERTLPSTEMTFAHYHIYWWSLFAEHNEWLETKAAAERRRFSKGSMKHDPDKPRVRVKPGPGDAAWLFIVMWTVPWGLHTIPVPARRQYLIGNIVAALLCLSL